jgi:hypothetical protein
MYLIILFKQKFVDMTHKIHYNSFANYMTSSERVDVQAAREVIPDDS